ncbi:MAG: DNA-binding protein WhiA [Lachnospiraceae bacterium]|nr:DNA-binding protein WhiA [Lachnospiraceae bacterium]
MSFSGKVKEEIISDLPQARHCQIAYLSAIVCTAGRVGIDAHRRLYLQIKHDNPEVKEITKKLSKNLFDNDELSDSRLCFKMLETTKLLSGAEDILSKKNKVLDEKDLHWDGLILRRQCCKRAFLKGLFLTSGSVNDPNKAYHLELVFSNELYAEDVKELLLDMELEAKVVERKKYFVVYIKDGQQIVDFLNIIGAPISLMDMENIRILKDVRNGVNRKVNCEAANIKKTVNAARKQIEDIELIEKLRGLESLPDGLYEMACLRLSEPDATLTELGEMLDPPVTKSGVNHRLRKISKIADELR